ncbi:MAG: hypothetical protein OEV44_11970 [Spirochaetota bacterium]|nr:hypothetical protein [Spirochaetota bacterium]
MIKIIFIFFILLNICNLTFADNSSNKTSKNTETKPFKSNQNYDWWGERDEIDTSVWETKDIIKNLMKYGVYYDPSDEIDIIYVK